MMKLLAFLWSGCWHKWEPTGHLTNVYEAGRRPPEAFPIQVLFRYRCEKCGRIRDLRS